MILCETMRHTPTPIDGDTTRISFDRIALLYLQLVAVKSGAVDGGGSRHGHRSSLLHHK